jgi:hypothetical protein
MSYFGKMSQREELSQIETLEMKLEESKDPMEHEKILQEIIKLEEERDKLLHTKKYHAYFREFFTKFKKIIKNTKVSEDVDYDSIHSEFNYLLIYSVWWMNEKSEAIELLLEMTSFVLQDTTLFQGDEKEIALQHINNYLSTLQMSQEE